MSKIYCTYLTIYSGNKLPPFYIGYKDLDSIQSGYRGSVSSKAYKEIWSSELQNNPSLFKTKILSWHETRKEAKIKETFFQKAFQVHKNPMYINRHISGESFYSEGPSPLRGRRSPLKGTKRPKNVRDKISRSKKGVPKSETHKKNLSISRIEKGLSKGIKNPMYNRSHTKIALKIQSEKRKEWYLYNSSPTLGLKRNNLSLRNSQSKGTTWVNKDQKNKQVPRDQIESFLELGWSKGMFR